MPLTELDLELQGARKDVARARVALRLALTRLHSGSSSCLQVVESGGDAYIGLQTLESEANEAWATGRGLERVLDRLVLVERIVEGVRRAS